ncbi:hypothetical protein ACH5RR_004068 [Cinchona calisaya]|uniref:Serine aminopeptidase S33 domain-containing protein n=1 Tax=Cinchona calisaya TaxID=153742 RepID=A0ABD3AWM1_9GENT
MSIITHKKGDGKKIVGLLHETGSAQVVVLCHGFGSSKASPTIVKLANGLGKEKISAFRFDFSGNGESEGDFRYANYWIEVDDLRAVVQYFTHVRNRKIAAILGHSKGANVVLLYASKYHDVPKVVNVAARFDLKRGIADRFGEDFLERIKRDGYIVDVKNKSGKMVFFFFFWFFPRFQYYNHMVLTL